MSRTLELPSPVRPVLLVAGLILAYLAAAEDAAAWVGAVLVVFGQSLRMFGLLFLVPGMLVVRREIALLAAALIATYTLPGLWLGVALVVGALVLSRHWPWLREPAGDDAAGTVAVAVRPMTAV
jgi:hypothetical protein